MLEPEPKYFNSEREREREREREMVDGDDIVTSEGGMIKLGCASLFSVRARERASER